LSRVNALWVVSRAREAAAERGASGGGDFCFGFSVLVIDGGGCGAGGEVWGRRERERDREVGGLGAMLDPVLRHDVAFNKA
jgi:hypothetical protein